MTDLEHEEERTESKQDRYMSTSYSNKIVCGVCGAPLRNLPAMYEKMVIDWRCGRCLRRDKPVLENHVK